jgi:hypothetical protein
MFCAALPVTPVEALPVPTGKTPAGMELGCPDFATTEALQRKIELVVDPYAQLLHFNG